MDKWVEKQQLSNLGQTNQITLSIISMLLSWIPRIGALYVREPSRLQPMLFGGGQERGLRPGTENTPMIVGLGACMLLLSPFHILFRLATI